MCCNLIFNAILQMRDYTMYDSFATGSIIMAHVFVGFVLAVIGFLLYKVVTFFNQYPTLS